MKLKITAATRDVVETCLTCKICNKLFEEATTITECLHTFCRKCLYDKITKEELDCCPECNVDLGPDPFENIRPDDNLQNVRDHVYPLIKRKNKVESLSNIEDDEKTGTGADDDHVKLRKQPKEEPIFGPRSMLPQAVFYDEENKPPTNAISFALFAAKNQEGVPPMPQIASRYVTMKDRNVPVSYIHKFIAKKLGLPVDQVEITCMGESVPQTMRTNELTDMWSKMAFVDQKVPPEAMSSSEGGTLKVLHYGWKKAPHP